MEATMVDEPTTRQPSQAPSDAVVPHTTGTTEWQTLSFPFTVDAEGCTVRFGIEQKFYHLATTQPNYNAMYSLLLACWVNRKKVSLEYRLPISGIPTPEVSTFTVVSIRATPADT